MKKVFTFRVLSIATTIALMSGLPFLTANAQTESFIPAEKRWTSFTGYTNADVPTDSTVVLWTQGGFPVGIKEHFERINNRWVLSQSGKMISDSGRDFVWEHTTHPENVGGDKVTLRYTYKVDEWGAPLSVTIPVDVEGMSITMETTYQYWRDSKNWVDSCLVTSTVFGMVMSKVRFKYHFASDGTSTMTETFYDIGGTIYNYSKFVYSYYKNASGKTERVLEEKYHHTGGATGPVALTSKAVIWYDANERAYREDVYDAISATKYDNYTITYYDGVTSNMPGINLLAQASVFVSNDRLIVNSSVPEVISIYSISGAQVYTGVKETGETQISINNFPQGVYIVQGSAGWVRKIIKQ